MKTQISVILHVDGDVMKIVDNCNKFFGVHTDLENTLGQGCNGVEVISLSVDALDADEDYQE